MLILGETAYMYMCIINHWTLLPPRSGLRLCPDHPTSILISSDSSGGSYLQNNDDDNYDDNDINDNVSYLSLASALSCPVLPLASQGQ